MICLFGQKIPLWFFVHNRKWLQKGTIFLCFLKLINIYLDIYFGAYDLAMTLC
ncbi:hypothetical protein HanRHA438_Chr14g0633971 [Helianthus annuus]|nr:hypothetical protein HanRHA438_Chr14g0633971 [Helianthus annuus]